MDSKFEPEWEVHSLHRIRLLWLSGIRRCSYYQNWLKPSNAQGSSSDHRGIPSICAAKGCPRLSKAINHHYNMYSQNPHILFTIEGRELVITTENMVNRVAPGEMPVQYLGETFPAQQQAHSTVFFLSML